MSKISKKSFVCIESLLTQMLLFKSIQIIFLYTAQNHNHIASVGTMCTVNDTLCPQTLDSSEEDLSKKPFNRRGGEKMEETSGGAMEEDPSPRTNRAEQQHHNLQIALTEFMIQTM